MSPVTQKGLIPPAPPSPEGKKKDPRQYLFPFTITGDRHFIDRFHPENIQISILQLSNIQIFNKVFLNLFPNLFLRFVVTKVIGIFIDTG